MAGKVVLVVGGGTDGPAADTGTLAIGNGRAAAMVCAREGAKVVVADRTLRFAEETVEAVGAEGFEGTAVGCDVVDEAQCRAAVEVAVATFGSLHGLVNNVGVADVGSVTDTDAGDFDRLYAVNLRGHFLMIKHGLPAIERSGGGAIVNVSSINALRSAVGVGYETTKAALRGLTRNVAMSAGRHNVRVNAVLPGAIDSPMLRKKVTEVGLNPDQLLEHVSKTIPLGRTGSPWEVATAIAFLLSDDASYITGVELLVDGGLDVPQP